MTRPPNRKHVGRNNGKSRSAAKAAEREAANAARGTHAGDNPAEVREGWYISDRGQRVRINGVSPWLIEKQGEALRAEWAEKERPAPDPPTYTMEIAGGGTETRPHDATTLRTDEDRAAWAAYLDRHQKFEAELYERTMRLLFVRGVKIPVELANDGDWIEEQLFLGIRVPENRLERRLWYVKTEIISSPQEAVRLMSEIGALSGISREALRAAEDTFQRAMEDTQRNEAERVDVAARGLVPQRDLRGSEDGAGVGDEAE